MSVFPLNIADKEDTPERLLALANVPEKQKYLASDTNQMVAALKELNGRSLFIDDTNGKEWFVRKAKGNEDVGGFQIMDRVEGFVDSELTEWIEGIIVGIGFSGVESISDTSKFFVTNNKIRIA